MLCGPSTIVYSASELRNKDAWEQFYGQITKTFDSEKVMQSDLPQLEGIEFINVFIMKKKPL